MTAEPNGTGRAEAATPGFRIRWGWFVGCIVAGLAAIAVGWSVIAADGRTGYAAGVLANVGTTLLLVGVVLLLERRIVDQAVKRFRTAAEESQARIRAEYRADMRNLTERLSAEWASASPDDADALAERSKRLSQELADDYVRRSLHADDARGDADD